MRIILIYKVTDGRLAALAAAEIPQGTSPEDQSVFMCCFPAPEMLRGSNLVTVTRSGRDAIHALAGGNVAHVIRDTIAQRREPHHSSQDWLKSKDSS
jgi:hypothetical protein